MLTDTGRGTREVGLVAKPPDMAEFFGMQALQVLITIVSILATGALLLRQKRRAAKWIRLRPRLDSVRIVVQLGSVIVIAALTGAGAPILALVLVGLFAVGPGYVQGRNLVIGDHDGKTYTIRNTLAASVWGAGLVIMQFAGLLRRTGILGLGQATAWVGVGLAIGLMIGRRAALTEYRQAAGRLAAPVATTLLMVLAIVMFGNGHHADAQDSGRWVQVSHQVNPAGDPPPDRWEVTLSATSVSVVESFGPEFPDDGEATFNASWQAPPSTLTPGDPLTIPVTVSSRHTGRLDTQYFFGLDVIMIVDGTWNREAVGAGASCAETTVISRVYVCSDPVTNSGEMVTTVPSFGDEFRIGVGALNCGGACYVEWAYQFEGDSAAGESPVATAPGDTGGEVGGEAETSDTDRLGDFVEQQTDETEIEPDEAMQAAIAGVLAALATGGISLIEAIDRVGDADRPETQEEEEEEEEEEDTSVVLELTYPVGPSPVVLQYGWLFGARCIIGAGTPDQRDVSDTVKWSGPATFTPVVGRRSRPAFKNRNGSDIDIGEGQVQGATIILTVDVDGVTREKKFPVNVVSTIGYARVSDLSEVAADAHGCPACPHACVGPIITGSGTEVFLHDLPVAAVGDEGVHAACCGPNMYQIETGDERVLINGKPAAWRHSRVRHCGGIGTMTTWHGGGR